MSGKNQYIGGTATHKPRDAAAFAADTVAPGGLCDGLNCGVAGNLVVEWVSGAQTTHYVNTGDNAMAITQVITAGSDAAALAGVNTFLYQYTDTDESKHIVR